MFTVVNRRQFFGAALAVGTALSAATDRRIIDTHTHFYDPRRPGGIPWPNPNDPVLYRPVLPAEYRAMTSKFGIVGTVEVEASPLVEDNQWILDLAAKDSIILGTVGHLEPGTPDFRKHLDRFTQNPRFLGIRISPLPGKTSELSSPAYWDDLKALHQSSRMIDVVGDGAKVIPSVLAISDRLPDLRIVIDHLPFTRPAESASLAELASRNNVFAKISNVPRKIGNAVPVDEAPYRDILDPVYETFGADRILYGSNWPVSDRVAPFDVALKIVTAYFARKPDGVTEKYFFQNANRVYRLPSK